jgi:hypothetical protein
LGRIEFFLGGKIHRKPAWPQLANQQCSGNPAPGKSNNLLIEAGDAGHPIDKQYHGHPGLSWYDDAMAGYDILSKKCESSPAVTSPNK